MDMLFIQNKRRGFEKGLADKRGWHGEILRMPGMRASFLHPFSYPPPQEKEDTILGTILPVFWALLVANPLPPTPFRNL